MASPVFILNGPNLNLLGKREPEIYGGMTLQALDAHCVSWAKDLGVDAICRQSNREGELVEWLHEAEERAAQGVVLNAGAYTHTSIALHDAIRGIAVPVLEVHLSNVHAREAFRHTSMIAPVACGSISGLGPLGYRLAIEAILDAAK
jgi:3-dehydroquinate dehydratase-2